MKSIKTILLLFTFCSGTLPVFSQSGIIQKNFAEVDGSISALTIDSVARKLYFGGSFTKVGHLGHYGATLDSALGKVPKSFVDFPNGKINKVISDQNGGWYIGGNFNRIGKNPVYGFAHLNRYGVPDTNNILYCFGGEVKAIAKTGNDIFLGGNFTLAGHKKDFSSYAALVDLDSGAVVRDWPAPNGTVVTSIPDGAGGWYIGGTFSKVGSTPAYNFAHIKSNKQVDTSTVGFFNSGYPPSGPNYVKVNSITRFGADKLLIAGNFDVACKSNKVSGIQRNYVFDSLRNLDITFPLIEGGDINCVVSDGMGGWFIGGGFSKVGGQPRKGLAHINAFKQVTQWDPNVTGGVSTLLLDGARLFVGGSYDKIGNTYISSLAIVDTSNGTVNSSFNLSLANTASVTGLYLYGNAIYIHGNFTSIGGVGRIDLASINRSTLSLTGWNPFNVASGYVTQVIGHNNLLFIAGSYSGNVGGSFEQGLCAVDTSTGIASSFYFPYTNSGAQVASILKAGNRLYMSGSFTSIMGITRNRFACLDLNTGTLTSLTLNIPSTNTFEHMSMYGSKMLVTGSVSLINDRYLNGIAFIDTLNGAIDSEFDFGYVTGSTYYSGAHYYVNGRIFFSSSYDIYVTGKNRRNVAVIDLNGNILPVQIQTNLPVNSADVTNNRILLGGAFTMVNGTTRNYLASTDTVKGQLFSFNPSPNAVVNSIVADKNIVYLGGNFTTLASTTRNRIAAIDTSGSLITSFNPNSNGVVNVLSKQGSYIYVGGNFTNIGTQSRKSLAAIDSATGNASIFNLNLSTGTTTNPSVYSICKSGNMLMGSGVFSTVMGQSRDGVFMYDLQTNVVYPWNPNHAGTGGSILTISAVSGSPIFIGGSDSLIGGFLRNGLIKYNEQTQTVYVWNPVLFSSTGARVNTLLIKDTSIFIAGVFSRAGGQNRDGIAVFNHTNSNLSPWNPSLTGEIYTLYLNNDTLYAGGGFGYFNGATRYNIAAINSTTFSNYAWNPTVSGSVNAICAKGNKLYIGGGFTSINSGTRYGFASFSNGLSTLDAYNPLNAGAIVNDISANGNNVYVAGDFTSYNSVTRADFVAFNSVNNILSGWNPNGVGTAYAIACQDSMVYVGGNSTYLGYQSPRNNLASLDLNTGELTSWNPNLNGAVNGLTIYNGSLYIGGSFTTFSGTTRNRIASVDLSSLSLRNWDPNANSTVGMIRCHNGLVYALGSFIGIGGQTRYYLAALDSSTGNATTWNPNPSASISGIHFMGNNAIVSGSFSTIGGSTRYGLASIGLNTGTASSWAPLNSAPAYAKVHFYRDTTLLITNSTAIVGVDTSTGVMKTMYSIGSYATSYVSWDSSIFFFGSFNTSTNKFISLLDPTFTKRTDWEPLPDGNISSMCLFGKKAYLGGSFLNIGGIVKRGLACFDLPGSYFVTDAVPQNLCKGISLPVPFTANMNFNSGNVFTAQLSDTSGSFSSPVNIGSFTSITSGEITSTIPSNTLSGTKYRIRVISSNPADTSEDNGYNIAISNFLSTPGIIQGDTLLCQFDTSAFYVNKVNNATQYTWSLPSGWTIIGASNDTMINVVAGLTGGTISVSASNACATSNTSSRTIYTDSVPAAPASIIGSTQTCKGDSVTFKINPVSRATGYQWNLPVSWAFASSNGDTIIKSLPGTMNGAITIKASNQCGFGSTTSLSLSVDSVPSMPSTITGSTSICKGSQQVYRINKVPRATTYNWTIPAGWSISGAATDTFITVNVGSSSGLITASAQNYCGVSAAKTFTVNVDSIPAQVSTITGPAPACANAVQLYKINKVTMATNYSWTIPSGWTMNSGQGDTAINVTIGTNSGNIIVIPSNYCGTGQPKLLSVNVQNSPSQPGSIQGNAIACKGTTQSYKMNALSGVSSYQWTVPTGWTIISGQGDTGITVVAGNNSGNISVRSVNACGNSGWRNLFVLVDSAAGQPGAIIGNAISCSGSNQTYKITKVSGAIMYNWSVPSGWTINGNATDTFINVTVGNTTGQITVYANFICGNSVGSTKNVSVENKPQNLSPITGKNNVCFAGLNTYNVNAISNATTYNWMVPSGWTIVNGTGTNTVALVTGTSGTIRVVAGNNCGNSDTSALTINTNSGPVISGIITGDTTACAGLSKRYFINPVAGNVSYTWVLPTGWTGTSDKDTIQVVTSANSGLVRVIVADSCGSSSKSVFVNINPDILPSTSINVSPSGMICSGDSVHFSSSVNNGGTTPTGEWLINGIAVGTGLTYSSKLLANNDQVALRITSNLQCANPSTVTSNVITMSVNATPAKPFISIAGNVLTSSSTTRNQWYFSNAPIIAATNPTYLVTQTGWYKVKVDNVLGCASVSDSVNILITGNRQQNISSSFEVFPSPVNSQLTIRAVNKQTTQSEKYEVKLVDALGRVVLSGVRLGEETSLDMSRMSQGIYMVIIENNRESFLFKIVKN
ncbi:MAG: T9SS type A sorting domain-containing protein [Bacteroidia bacterium]|nr:T9SS type A sorting domain-containing protein [Bacteroidia bacterium]MBP7261674.1 T9SS type A sorting domain-containing protein [Bacteroidia bacterium]MBP9180787.1 T9SS type A sorting domain-containing protein [Bacteroidia bacterium]MBP9724593.1 T9SS type A sorting domain-containing protein [Bacteroidia bacterium]